LSRERRDGEGRGGWRGLAWAVLLVIAGLAFAVRAAQFPQILLDDGEVVLRLDDSQYHARRALYTYVNFPRVLERDRYLNFPKGADVPWPPLYDFALGALGRLLADRPEGLARVLAWVPVALGTLTVFLVYAIGRTVGGRGLALGAAGIFAFLTASVDYTDLGNPDHHAAVALFGAALLALHAAGARPETRRFRLAAVHVGLVAARLAMLLTWHGSLLYLALAEITATAVLAGLGRRDALAAEAASAFSTAVLVLPAVLTWPAVGGGPWSTVELSRLHVAALVAVAAAAAASAWLESRRPAATWAGRLARLGALAAVAAGALLALPGPRSGLAEALAYAGKENPWIAHNLETQAIFAGGSTWIARSLYGGFAFLLPLAPAGALLRARRPRVRGSSLVLAGWTLCLGALALDQARYGNDFAPAGCVSFALLLAEGSALALRRLPRGRRLAAPLAALLGVALLAPLVSYYAAFAPAAWQSLRGARPEGDPALDSLAGTLLRFAEQLRAATPETSGFLDADAQPEYGVLTFPVIGLVVQNIGRRPTPADNFGPYLEGSNLAAANRFYALRSEEAALRLAESLKLRYVVTAEQFAPSPAMLLHRLHREDGRGRGAVPRLEHFRLVTEGPPAGGVSIAYLKGRPPPPGDVPYKLFEIVPGAVLEVRAPPGSGVTAEVEIATPTGRRFTYPARTQAGADGVARLRVPYATDGRTPVHTTGPWRVHAGGQTELVPVSERDLLSGATVAVPDAGGS
jgi:dolichyl-phosphooligosaccharide-protein glycotransferase